MRPIWAVDVAATRARAASFSADGAEGQIALPRAGSSRGAFLSDGVARDTDTLLRVELSARPAGGGLWVYAVARRSRANEYRPKLLVNQNGVISVHAGAFVNGAESSVAPVQATGLTLPPAGGSLWLRSQVTGINPTTISVKAWLDGTLEPSGWQFNATSSAAVLQDVGDRACGRTSRRSQMCHSWFEIDDLAVRSLDAPSAPVADFTWLQQDGTLSVGFADASSNNPTDRLWDFGDGSTSTEPSPTHVYATDGEFTVSLTVTGPGGSDSETHLVAVEAPPPPPTVTTIAADDFDRSGASFWGVAQVGDLYSYQGTVANFSVTSQRGVVTLPAAGASRGAFLFSTLVRDATMHLAVSTDKAAAGSSIYVYGALRRATDGSMYRAKLRFAPNGAVFAHASRFVNNGESSLGRRSE